MTVTETMTEISTATEMAMAISRNSWPTGSVSNSTGMKTITVVSAEPRIGAHTWRAP